MNTDEYIIKINNALRQRMSLTIGTYCVADAIHKALKGSGTIGEIHSITGISPNWIEASLSALIKDEYVKQAPRTGKFSVTKKWKEDTKPEKKAPADSKIISRMRKECESRNLDYYWKATDAMAATTLSKQISFSFNNRKHRMPSEDEIFSSFLLILDNLPDFWQNKWDLSMVSGKYTSIVTQIRDNHARKLASETGVGSDHHRTAAEHIISDHYQSGNQIRNDALLPAEREGSYSEYSDIPATTDKQLTAGLPG